MAGWHHWFNGHESEWTPGVGNGQGGLVCCDSWGGKESDMTKRLNWTELENKVIKPVNLKGNQPRIFFERTDAEAEVPVLWPLDLYSWLIGKDHDARKDWRQKEKRVIEGDGMVGWHHWFTGYELGQTLGDCEGHNSLVCCNPWGQEELDKTWWLNNNNFPGERNKLAQYLEKIYKTIYLLKITTEYSICFISLYWHFFIFSSLFCSWRPPSQSPSQPLPLSFLPSLPVPFSPFPLTSDPPNIPVIYKHPEKAMAPHSSTSLGNPMDGGAW